MTHGTTEVTTQTNTNSRGPHPRVDGFRGPGDGTAAGAWEHLRAGSVMDWQGQIVVTELSAMDHLAMARLQDVEVHPALDLVDAD